MVEDITRRMQYTLHAVSQHTLSAVETSRAFIACRPEVRCRKYITVCCTNRSPCVWLPSGPLKYINDGPIAGTSGSLVQSQHTGSIHITSPGSQHLRLSNGEHIFEEHRCFVAVPARVGRPDEHLPSQEPSSQFVGTSSLI